MRDSTRPWFHRAIHDSRLTPLGASLVGGLLWAAIIGATWLVLCSASTGSSEPTAELLRYCFRTSAIVSLMLWGSLHLVHNLDHTIQSLAPHMTLSQREIAQRRTEATHYRSTVLAVAGAAGMFFCMSAAEISYRGVSDLLGGRLSASGTTMLITRLPLFYLVGQVLYIIFALMLRMRRLGAANLEVRLFALRRLEPFARMGLSLAFLLAVAGTLVTVTGPGAEMSFNLFIVVPVMAAAVAAAAIPFFALRTRIIQEKELELGRIDRALEGDRSALESSPMREQLGALDLPGLLAYQRHVDEVSNWPFFSSVSRSLGLYVLIPTMGWVAAALVEIALERLV